MQKKRTLIDSLSTRWASARVKSQTSRMFRLLGGRGAAAIALGAVLSVGGLTDALSGVHFLVEKDLDSVRVLRENDGNATVVADVQDAFAANSIFKLSRVLPDRLVTQKIALFNDSWLPEPLLPSTSPRAVKRGPIRDELARINTAIRAEFFANAMPYGDLIHEKALKYDVDPALVAAVIEQESKFRRQARSQVGAKGLMQLMPRTGRWMGARDLYDPEQNVDAGVRYIKYLQERFDGNVNKTIAAYNAGEGNVKRYGGIPPFRETQTYVRKVLHNYNRRNAELRQFNEDAKVSGAAADVPEGIVTIR